MFFGGNSMEIPKKNIKSKVYVFYADVTYKDGRTDTFGINGNCNKEYYLTKNQALVNFFNSYDFWNFYRGKRQKTAERLNAKSFDDYIYKYLNQVKENITKRLKKDNDIVSYKVRFIRANTKNCPFNVDKENIHNLFNRKTICGNTYYGSELLYSVSIYEKKAKEVETS